MSCKISTAPINISTNIRQPGGSQTQFTYDYGLANCKLTNKKTYLDIECYDGVNKTEYNDIGYLDVTSVRVFRPSLNTYDGQKAHAEIIITHTGNGRNLYICVPIMVSAKKSDSVNWFSQIINHVPVQVGSKVSVNVSNFSLNSIIPKASYFVFNNGTFNWGCNSKDIMILFDKNDAIGIKSGDYQKLVSRISQASYNVNQNPEYVRFNRSGTKAGPGKSANSLEGKQLTCTPITDLDGNNIEGKPLAWSSDFSDNKDKAKDYFSSVQGKYLIIIIAVILGIVLVSLLGYGMHKLFKKNKTSVPSAPSAG